MDSNLLQMASPLAPTEADGLTADARGSLPNSGMQRASSHLSLGKTSYLDA